MSTQEDVTLEVTEESVIIQVIEQPIIFEIGDGYPISISGSGSGSGSVNTYEELLIGEIDNENKVFTTNYEYELNSTQIYKNGLRQRRGVNYTESDTKEITLVNAPLNYGIDDELLIIYTKV